MSVSRADTAPASGIYEHICKANVNGSQTVTANVDHLINFEGADSWDTYSIHDTSTNNGRRFVVVDDGKYRFTLQINYSSSPGGSYLQFEKVGGGSTTYGAVYATTSGSSRSSMMYVQTIEMVAGDYVQCHGFRTSGTGGAELGGFLEVERVG